MFAGFASFMKCPKSPETEVKPKAVPQQAEVKPAQVKPQSTPQQPAPPQATPPRDELTPAVRRVIANLFYARYPSIDFYWEVMALRGNSLPREFTINAGYADVLHARQLSAALTRAGYLGFVCEGTKCKRMSIEGELPPVRFNYSELVAQGTHEHVIGMINTARGDVDARVNVVDDDGVCHVSVAMEMARVAQNAGRYPFAEGGRIHFGRDGGGDISAANRARLESYCRERNFDII